MRERRPLRPQPSRAILFSRFLFDLEAIIALAKGGSTRHAWQLASMYREAHRKQNVSNPAVTAILRRMRWYMEAARKRYAADPPTRRSIAKALLVETTKRGRKPRAEGGRRVSDEALTEAVLIFREAKKRHSEKFAVSVAAEKTGISARAIRTAIRADTKANIGELVTLATAKTRI